jgi:hypothetical protein
MLKYGFSGLSLPKVIFDEFWCMMLFPFIAQASPSQSMNHFQTFRGS